MSKVQLLSTFQKYRCGLSADLPLKWKKFLLKASPPFILCKPHLVLKWWSPWSHQAGGICSVRVTTMTRRSWEAGRRPGPGRQLPWWPSPPAVVERLSRQDGSGNEGGRSPGSSSTSRLCAGPVVDPVIHRWPAWRPDTTALLPRRLGCPRWSVRRLASPERRAGQT